MNENAVLKAEHEKRLQEIQKKLAERRNAYSDKSFIDMLNKIIEAAIDNGKDCENPEPLINEMRFFLKWTGAIGSVGIINDDGFVQFYMKDDIVE